MVKARGITMTNFDVFLLIAFTVSVLTGAACMFVPRNPILGIRTAWSEYNDVTWKSNKFLGILLVIVGLVSMITFFTISSDMAETVFLVLLIASFLISVIYSKFVCAKEKEKH